MVDVVRQNRSAQLAERIRSEIELKRPADGSLFMTEAEVAETYEVSRTVAREAVGRLRAIGLLEGVKKKGLIVRTPDPVRLFAAGLPSLAKSQEAIAELAELRYALEVGSIELAVKHATAEQLDRLQALAEQIRAKVVKRGGLKRIKQLDIDFHSLLLEMTGSKLVGDMQRVVVEFFTSVTWTIPPLKANVERVVWEHLEIAAAVRDRDAERARSVLRTHLSSYLRLRDAASPAKS